MMMIDLLMTMEDDDDRLTYDHGSIEDGLEKVRTVLHAATTKSLPTLWYILDSEESRHKPTPRKELITGIENLNPKYRIQDYGDFVDSPFLWQDYNGIDKAILAGYDRARCVRRIVEYSK